MIEKMKQKFVPKIDKHKLKTSKGQTTIEYVVIAVVVIVAATLAGLYVMSMTSHAHIGTSSTLDGAVLLSVSSAGSTSDLGIEVSTPLPSNTLSVDLDGNIDSYNLVTTTPEMTIGGTYEYELSGYNMYAGNTITSVISGTTTYTTASGSPITLEPGTYPFSEGTGLSSS